MPISLTIFFVLLLVPLLSGHALDGLHTAAGGAGAVAEAGKSLLGGLPETADEAGEHAHAIP